MFSYSRDDIIDDVEDLSVSDVLFLGIVNCSPAKITRIQKLSLFASRILDLGPELSHYAFDYGGFSNEMQGSELSLENDGAVLKDHEEFTLTSYGKALLEEASNDPRFKGIIDRLPGIVAYLESLSDWDLKQLSYIVYPDTAVKSTIKHMMDLDASAVGDFRIRRDLSREQMQRMLLQSKGSVNVLDRLKDRGSVIVSDVNGNAVLVTRNHDRYITAERVIRFR